jgi:hypothetical protein
MNLARWSGMARAFATALPLKRGQDHSAFNSSSIFTSGGRARENAKDF